MKVSSIIYFTILILLTISGLRSQTIHEVSKEGDLVRLEEIIRKDPQLINSVDSFGRTPLHWASRGVHFEILKYLLDEGADPNIRDKNMIAPIVSIVARNHGKALMYMLLKGAEIDIKDREKETPLHIASAYGMSDMVNILIQNGAPLEIRNAYERTPLLLAAREAGDLETIKCLVDNGAEIDTRDNSNNSPLILAAWRGYEEVVDYLIDKGAYVPMDGIKGKKLFEYALNKNQENLYLTILRMGV